MQRIVVLVAVIWTIIGLVLPVWAHEGGHATVTSGEGAVAFFLGRDDCGVCQAQKDWLATTDIHYEYINVLDGGRGSELFEQLTHKHDIAKITPITVIGETVIQGFNGPETTGELIRAATVAQADSGILTLESHIARAPKQDVFAGAGCDENGIECNVNSTASYNFDLPFIGVIDLKSLSLFSLSAILGVIDGFNPCAMWVLVTFLVLLSQAGSRKKMAVLAGIFIFAEAIMYNLILNVWYKTWDFVALDQIVTPVVGLLALGGGGFFLYRWYKNRKVALVCDISSIDQQMKTVDRFKRVVNEPLTIATFGAIILIAFSVNIIEFACSIGIPQAYTKILDLNMLTFLERQFYILVYTLGYMLDDVIVFGLAIWGFSKLEAHGHKYAQLSLLIGGVLMLALGAILVYNPQLLVL